MRIRLQQLHCPRLCCDHINNNNIDIDYDVHDNHAIHDNHDHNHHAASMSGWLPWLRQSKWHLCRGWGELAM
jgi:hypothetical protein